MSRHERLRYEILNERARQDYGDYVERTHGGLYKHARHTRLLCKYVDKLVAEKNKKIMIFLPPRHSKSMTITETLPSYFLGKNPDARTIISAHTDSLAKTFSRRNKQKVEDYGKELFNIEIAKDRSSVRSWDIKKRRGGLIASGIFGTITGEGADLLLMDDLIKNAKIAQSAIYRQSIDDEYRYTLSTRCHADASKMLTLTRWHADDQAGRILGREDGWEVIRLPAICDSNDDPIGRKIGEPLWPEHGYDLDFLEKKQIELGSKAFTSLYQQSPTLEAGDIIHRDWIRLFDKLPEQIDEWTQSWDFTFNDTAKSDFVCGGVWARSGSNHYLVHRVKERLDFIKSINRIQSISNSFPQAVRKIIEAKANGPAIISMLKNKLSGIIAVSPTESKISRLTAVAPFYEAGNVHIPRNAIWAEDYISELVQFPNGKNDDQVDMSTQYLARYIKKRETTVEAKIS